MVDDLFSHIPSSAVTKWLCSGEKKLFMYVQAILALKFVSEMAKYFKSDTDGCPIKAFL